MRQSRSRFAWLLAALFLTAALPAQALNRIDLAIGDTVPSPGDDVVEIAMSMNFDDPTLGGRIGISYDSTALTFLSFAFDSTFTGNFALLEPAAGSVENPLIVGAAWFFVAPPIGPAPIGSFLFQRLDPTAPTTLASEAVPLFGFASQTSTDDLAVDFGSLTIPAVPEPSTALLLMGGLATLSAARDTKGRR